MFKKILTIILSLVLILNVFTIISQTQAALMYDYEYIDQSPYPSPLTPGEITNVWLEVKNTGTATWYNNGDTVVRLGTGSVYGDVDQQKDYTSEIYDPVTWLSPNRPVAILDSVVAPGQTTHFQFNIKAPSSPGVYKAYFTPVADGVTWMKDIGIYWQVTVVSEEGGEEGNNQSGSNITVTSLGLSPSSSFSIQSGDTTDFTVTAYYSDGSTQDVTDMAVWEVEYITGTGTMHTDIPGRFIAGGIGTCQVKATFAGESVTSGTINITPLS